MMATGNEAPELEIYVAAKKYDISISLHIDPECGVPLHKYNSECRILNVYVLRHLNVFYARKT